MTSKLLLLFSFLVLSISGFSQTYIWDGNSDGDGDGIKWADEFNWNLDEVPKPGSIVEIGGDSVLLGDGVQIQELILESGGILYFESSRDEFLIEGSTSEGVTINGGAKFYINGNVKIQNVANNGIDLQANSDLIIEGNNGTLQIISTGSDGILGGIGATFTNSGQVFLDNIGSDGLDLRHFYNTGGIDIQSTGEASVKFSGSVGINEGNIQCDQDAVVQVSSNFINDSGSLFRVDGVLSIASDFDNYGRVDLRNTSGTSFSISSGVTFTNNDRLFARTSSGTTFSLVNGAKLENAKDAVFRIIPSLSSAIGDYIFEMDGPSTKLINRGLIDIDLGQKMKGFFLENRSIIENYGDFYLDDYNDTGFFIDPIGSNTEVVQNIDTAFFAVGPGNNADAVAFEFNTRVRIRNDSCATMIFEDSVAIQGSLGMRLENYGLLELESFSKKSNAVFENEGAVFINDTSLAHNPNPSLVGLINNNGLVVTPIPGLIVENVTVNPFFDDLNPSNVELFFNQVWVKNPSTGIVNQEGGSINLSTNTWTPNFRAPDADTITIFYRHTEQPCDGNYFTIELPVVFQGCNAITYTFNESVDNKWNNPNNWTPVGVPSACDHAIIPAGTSCMVVPSYPGYGFAKTLLVEQGAVFQTINPMVLSINPFAE